MTVLASTFDKIAEENRILRQKLAIAEQWIGREFSGLRLLRTKKIVHGESTASGTETRKSIRKRIQNYFGHNAKKLTEDNWELLIESEINFEHMVRQKDIDGFIVTNDYQKILEQIFEVAVTEKFRETHKKSRLHPAKNDLLEKTLYKALYYGYRLSLGKIYEALLQSTNEAPSPLSQLYLDAIQGSTLSPLLNMDQFWEYFTGCIETEAFGGKRHDGKITLIEARLLRKIITGNYEEEGLLKLILQNL